jgi:tRNA(Ile)-lysidine synthase
MESCAPFEPAPLIAVAVSGGGDSMALLRLADAWARSQGGNAVALTVDHGLRPDSAQEAAEVERWAAALGVEHRTLSWQGPKPQTRLMERARAARYALLENACAEAGILHLLLAHHADDQAETIALRRNAKSGPHGLAGMTAQRFTSAARLLRPLLDVPKARLLATCRARGQAWFEDPSNRDPRFLRARLRARPLADGPVASPSPHAAAAIRSSAERTAAQLAAAAVLFDPRGFAVLDRAALAAANPGIAALVVARVVQAVGAAPYPAPNESCASVAAWLDTGLWRGRERPRITLGRCVLALQPTRLIVAREARGLPPPVVLAPGRRSIWDRRFAAIVDESGWTLGALGTDGWAEARALRAAASIPPEARASLAVLRSRGGQTVFPFAPRTVPEPSDSAQIRAFRWLGSGVAFPAAFTVVWPPRRIMF